MTDNTKWWQEWRASGTLNIVGKIKCYSQLWKTVLTVSLKDNQRDFPGGPVVKNLPASVGNTGSIPDPKRSHIQQLRLCATLLSLCSGAHEPQFLSLRAAPAEEAHAPRTCAPQRETPPQGEAVYRSKQWPPRAATGEKPAQQQRICAAKNE